MISGVLFGMISENQLLFSTTHERECQSNSTWSQTYTTDICCPIRNFIPPNVEEIITSFEEALARTLVSNTIEAQGGAIISVFSNIFPTDQCKHNTTIFHSNDFYFRLSEEMFASHGVWKCPIHSLTVILSDDLSGNSEYLYAAVVIDILSRAGLIESSDVLSVDFNSFHGRGVYVSVGYVIYNTGYLSSFRFSTNAVVEIEGYAPQLFRIDMTYYFLRSYNSRGIISTIEYNAGNNEISYRRRLHTDENYRYYIDSNPFNFILVFEDGRRYDLLTAFRRGIVTIEDLIQSGISIIVRPICADRENGSYITTVP